MEKGYTLEYLAKLAKKQQRRKGYRGWFEVPNAGNVPHNIEMFNKMSGAASAETPSSMMGDCTGNPSSSGECTAAVVEGVEHTRQEAVSGKVSQLSKQLTELAPGEVITLKGSGVSDYPYLKITRNSKHPNLYRLWNESPIGEISNEINFSTLSNTLYWASQCDELVESYMSSNYRDTIELEYPEITVEVVTRHGNPGGYFSRSYGNWLPDDDETKEIEVPFTYEADALDVRELVGEWIADEDPVVADMPDDEYSEYLDEHLDDLVERYYDRLLAEFEDAATEAAQEQDWEDWLYEDCNESNPYIFKDLQEAANSDIELKDYWEDLPPVEEEYFEPTSTRLEFEGIDQDDPVLEGCKYEWTDFDPDKCVNDWELVASKDVFDADGFVTSYNWYKSVDGDCHIFNFEGDPVDAAHADHECESEKEAIDWFNTYKGYEDDLSALDDIPDLDAPAQVEDLDFDDNNNIQPVRAASLQEGKIKDLDIDIQYAGSKEELILKLEKDLAALDSEISFLEDAPTIETDPDSVFGSKEVIDRAIESARKDRELVIAKLGILRG